MPTDPTIPRLRRTFAILTACTLAVFVALVAGLTIVLRQRLREQILQREAEAIQSVAEMQIRSAQARFEKLGTELPRSILFGAVLESSRLRDVLAVELFDEQGVLRESLPAVTPDTVHAWWPGQLARPVARFERDGTLEQVLGITPEPGASPTRLPLLDVAVPLVLDQRGTAVGLARYWIDGSAVGAELRALDRSLAVQAGTAAAGGSLLVGLLIAWTYRQLRSAQRQLVAQTVDLARANEELDFAAKTGALGAISAHLIHGLRNPLAGLEGFVAETVASGDAPPGAARQQAVETAQRLRALVNEVVAVLRDEAAGEAGYRVPLSEVVDAIRSRTAPLATKASVHFAVSANETASLAARAASLASLVLANLLTNAIEASPPGTTVRLTAAPAAGGIEFVVTDAGPGLPPEVRQTLFRPVRSRKPGGGGLGLAISHRLARHAGGELSLVRSDGDGTVFRLLVPEAP